MSEKRQIKVFMASPSDLAAERRAFKDQIDNLNLGFGDGAAIEFIPLGWEDTLATTGRRPQGVINADVDACDVFVLAMHRRWGQEAPDSKYDSYTEEEFHLALDRFSKTRSPEIFVFFKHVDAASIADAGPQLAKVLAFRRQLEQSRQVLYRSFADTGGFAKEVDSHLRAYAKGDLPEADATRDVIVLPIEYVRRVEQAEAQATKAVKQMEGAQKQAEAQAARADELALALARQAADAARDGHIEQARQSFARAISGTTNLWVLYLAFEFYYRTGELPQAEQVLSQWLALAGPDAETPDTAAAYGALGLIYYTRGDLDQAEAMHRKSLVIEEKLGHLEGMAVVYSNLGLIYDTRGDLEQAEAMHRKSLAIDEKLGHLEGMARQYGNLGVIYDTRGDLDQAEAMHRKALEIDEKLGRLEGMAAAYGNLGIVYNTRGDLDQAEAMHRKALEIEEKLGHLEGMGADYENLGDVLEARGDAKGARALWTKARDLYSRLGNSDMATEMQTEIDRLPPEPAQQ
ncbi:MAG TPA: tetratricopeptide repeat protein [Phycisphaerae bacterium]|nr:tetratricopeptide repeat protein [Phycisphaerae bacterium]